MRKEAFDYRALIEATYKFRGAQGLGLQEGIDFFWWDTTALQRISSEYRMSLPTPMNLPSELFYRQNPSRHMI